MDKKWINEKERKKYLTYTLTIFALYIFLNPKKHNILHKLHKLIKQ